MPFAWGRYYTDEELQQIAEEMNKIGRTMEDVHRYTQLERERREAKPDKLVF